MKAKNYLIQSKEISKRGEGKIEKGNEDAK